MHWSPEKLVLAARVPQLFFLFFLHFIEFFYLGLCLRRQRNRVEGGRTRGRRGCGGCQRRLRYWRHGRGLRGKLERVCDRRTVLWKIKAKVSRASVRKLDSHTCGPLRQGEVSLCCRIKGGTSNKAENNAFAVHNLVPFLSIFLFWARL